MRSGSCPVVALVGRPNVGKSTLFNRLTRSRQAIVDPTPGVTRDRHYQQIDWAGIPVLLVDTGGIELAPQEPLGARVQEQTLQAVAEADAVLFLVDGRQELAAEDYRIIARLRRTGKPLLCAVNKLDEPQMAETLLPSFYELGVESLWPISAEHGQGIAALMDALAAQLPPVAELPDLPENTIKIAFVGRPNVGKSSLINRLLGEDRMLVSDIPGTTRDSVDSLIVDKGQHYLLIDTAGIRRKGKVSEKLEKFSVIKALAALEHSDIALILLDAGEGITEQDTKIIGYGLEQGRACIILFNKWDLVRHDPKLRKYLAEQLERSTRFVGFAPSLSISALTGAGVKKILPAALALYGQYCLEAGTGRLNKILEQAMEGHPPALYRGKRLRFYYTTQVGTKPPTFAVFTNYPKGVHFSYHRYLVNAFREGLGLDKSPLRIVLKERPRKKKN